MLGFPKLLRAVNALECQICAGKHTFNLFVLFVQPGTDAATKRLDDTAAISRG